MTPDEGASLDLHRRCDSHKKFIEGLIKDMADLRIRQRCLYDDYKELREKIASLQGGSKESADPTPGPE